MKKRGFTLVELLAVIVILAIVSLIIFPIVTKEIASSKKDLYDIQIKNIIKAAKDMVLDDPTLLDSTHLTPTFISIEDMQSRTNNKGVYYLEKGKVKNPNPQKDDGSDEFLNGTVVITYDINTNSYEYAYEEKTKVELQNEFGESASKTIILNNDILSNEEESGLFEDITSNKYIFKGENPNNYIKINDSIYRIVSIDKDTYMMKIVKITHQTKTKWNTSGNDISFSNINLNVYTYLNSDFYNSLDDKVKNIIYENATWNIGSISENTKDIRSILIEEKASSFNANVGLLSVGDFVNASYSLECRNDYTNVSCSSSNYLIKDSDYFLINNVKNESYVWSVSNETGNNLKKASPASQYSVLPTLYIKNTAKLMAGGTGTLESPYIIDLS